ncbi:hypothetical protein JYQ62_22090 [Nostoc sp. UHCC 0702]|nr:hypothetical protein JYQ62_22090 [Nostoc sp. UHCC 0702]
MTATKAIIGQGTKILVAPIGRDRIFPEATVFSVSADAAAAATSLSISFTPAITRTIFASTDKPLYLNFTQEDGVQHLVKVTANIEPASNSLTVGALKKAVKQNATAPFPVILSKRTSANLTDQDAEADVNVFENSGWKDSITTLLGNGLEMNGFYDALDAGWNICNWARYNFAEVYCELQLKPPSSDYTKGHIFKLFSGVKIPLEIPSDNIINANISLMSRGPVTIIDPA